MRTPVKVTVNISDDALAALRQMAACSGVTITGMIARSIGTERYFEQQRAAGNKILVLRPDGSLHKVLPYSSGH